MESHLRERLSNQMKRGDLVLFTGAGFSLSAKRLDGNFLPSTSGLKKILWSLALPNDPYEEDSKLGDIYDCAVRKAGNQVKQVLRESLTVDAIKGVPECYRVWFSMPWTRIYTLNIDDLDDAVKRAYHLPRNIRSISTVLDRILPPVTFDEVQSIHLNGTVSDFPRVTFSPQQYGERATQPDALYVQLVNDLISHPILFVGTTLDEPPLWQYIEFRRSKERQSRELRPGSYLVTGTLSAARRDLLENFNIQHIPMSQEDFAQRILATLDSEKEQGLLHLSRRRLAYSGKLVERVAELRARVEENAGEFILGFEPTWQDITGGESGRPSV